MPITPRSSLPLPYRYPIPKQDHTVDVALLDSRVITGLIIASACSSKQFIRVRNYLKEQELFHCPARTRKCTALIGASQAQYSVPDQAP
jgi:hypothetical protein